MSLKLATKVEYIACTGGRKLNMGWFERAKDLGACQGL